MSEAAVNQIHCKLQIPDVVGLEKDILTVGRHFYLNCEGLRDPAFDFSKATVMLDENSKNTIKVFKIEARNANSFDVDLVLYVAGELKSPSFKITDGSREIDLGAQDFKVKTVIEQAGKPPEKPPEPFGYMISQLHWPWQYSAGLLLFFVLVLASVLAYFLNKMKWRGRIERLKNYDSPIQADSQFYKELRKIEKKDYPIFDLEKICKVYILRSFKIPVFELTHKQSISFLKSKLPRLKNERRLMYNLLKDLELLKNIKNNDTDLEKRKKFIDQFYRFVDAVEDLKSRGQL